jgi:cobalamin biosynthesis protein CobT
MKVNNRVLVMREAITKIVPMLTQRSVKVTQQGTQAFVEYHGTTLEVKRVNLPYIPEDASDQLLDATQGFLDHEVGHVLFTEQKFVKKAAKLQVHSLHNMIEDTFVERKMGEKFPGCGSNLTRMHGFFLTEWIDTQLKEKPEHAAAILMVCAIRAWAGQPAFVGYMKDKWSMMEDVVNRLGADFPKMIRGVNSSEAGLKVAIEAKKRLTPKPQPKAPTPPTPPQPAPPEPPKAEEPQPSDDENAKNGAEQSSGESHDDADDKEPQQPNDMPNLTDEEPEQSASSAPQPEGDDEDEDELDDAEGEEDREPEGEPEQEQPAPAPGDEEDDDAEDTESPLDVNEPDDDLDDEDEDTSTEQDDEGDNAGGGMSGEEADNDHDVGDEEGAPSGGGDGLPGGEESGDTAESDAGDAGGQDENGAGQQDAGDEEGHGTPEAGEGDQPIERDPNDDRDFFKEFEDADVKEFDEAAAEALSKQAVEAARGADYIVFTRDEDVLEVLDVPDAFGQEEVTRMQSKVDHMIGPLQKDLQRAIAARSAAIWTGGHRRGQLHGASLARVLTGRDDVFRQKQVSRTKDVAVSLLVDASGSMWEHDKIRVATYAAYALSAVLDNIGITNEVLAFSTKELSFPAMSAMHKEASEHGLKYSRGAALDMRILKSYAERMTPLVRRRFALLAGANAMLQENVDGESVQIANHRLQQQRATRKVMMVLSDGMPACDGRRSPVLASHLKEVVRQIEKRGTDVVALGILDPSVKQFYDRALVLNSVAELPGVVMKELHRLLVQ